MTKLILVVTWGLILGQPDGERRWSLTAEELDERQRDALGEAMVEWLAHSDASVSNWCTLEWVWT